MSELSASDRLIAALLSHTDIACQYGIVLTEEKDARHKAEEAFEILRQEHLRFVYAVGIATAITPGITPDINDPAGMMLAAVEQHANTQAYARSAYEALGKAEQALQQAGVLIARGNTHPNTGDRVAATSTPDWIEEVKADVAEAREECIRVLQAVETF